MNRTSKGFIWSFAERFMSQGASFFISIILARLVAPESYGLLVMVQIFITFSNIFVDGGFGKALIQNQNRTDRDYDTAFLFNIGFSVVLYLILFLSAPFISSFYKQPQLVSIVRIVGINIIICGFSVVPKAIFNLNLDFKSLAKVNVSAILTSGIIGIVLAYQDFEVWALVAQTLTYQTMMSAGMLLRCSWKPMLRFSMISFKKMFGYGSKLLINSVFSSLYVECTNLLVGKFYSPAQLAFYNRAFKLAEFPSTNIVTVLNRVSFPLECESQNDREKLKDVYYKNLHLSNYVCIPLLLFCCFFSKPIIHFLLTDKWIQSAEYLTLFSINFLVYPIVNEIINVISAVGRSDMVLKSTIYRRIISFVILFCTLLISVKAVCIGIIVSSYIELFILFYLLKKCLDYRIKHHIKALADIIITCFTISFIFILIILFIKSYMIQLATGLIIEAVLFILGTYVFNMPEKNIINKFKNKLLSI